MISKYSVKRPYTVLVAVVLVIVLGVVSLSKMTTDLLPDMSFQYALVITTDMGASPEQVESDVTAPIESAMATTSNIKNISSISYNSYSIVTLEYEQNANMDSVVIEIQQSLDQISGQWDDSIGTPMIMKVNPDMLPVLAAAVDVDGMDATKLSEYVENELSPAIESLEGVASVTTTGQLEEGVQVTLNQDKIDALNKKVQKSIDKQFAKSQKEIDANKKKVEDGQSSINTGSDQLTDAINQTMDKQQELLKTEKDLKNQLADLKKQQKSLSQIQSGIQTFMQSDAYTGIVSVLKDNPQLAESEEMKAQIKQLNKVVKEQFAALSSLGITVNTYEDLPAASAEVGKLLAQVNTGIKTIESAQKKVESGKVSLSSALDTLNANASLTALKVSTSSAELTSAASSLEDAQSKLDDAKDNAYDSADLNKVLSEDTITSLLAAQNFDMPAGYAMDGDTQYLVRVGDAVEDVEDLKKLPLIDMGIDGVKTICLSDVADVTVTDNSDETYAVINGNPGIMLSMEKQTGYSTGEVTDRILEKFKSLEKEDSNLHLSVLMNQGVYIDMIVNSVMQNMIWGALLAILVLLLFLKDIKPTIVIACSIPLSVVAAVVLMYFTGITLNIISMSGLMLGIGMLVDNSIVVIENIYRLRGEGYSIKKAAVEGSKQVTGAIIASTLTTVSVYAPIIFTEGITRQLFVDLALTIAYTLVASLVVALTFVPAMSSVTLRRTKEIRHPWFDAMKEWYGRALAWCLRFKPVVLIVAVVLLVASAALSVSKGLNFMDMDMETNQISVSVSAKEGEKLTFQELTEASDQVMKRISDIKGIDTIGAMAGGNSTSSLMGGGNDSVSMYILLDEDADVKVSDVTDAITEKTKDLDCEVSTNTSSMDYSSYFGSGLSVRIKGNDIETLQKLAGEVADVMKDTKGTTDIDDGMEDSEPQLTISVDKKKAAKYGLTVAQVYQLVSAKMADSKTVTTITTDIKDYKVYVQTEEQADTKLSDIKDMTFSYTNKNGKEKEIPLTKICKMKETSTLSTISRDAQTRYITVSCGVDEDHNVTLVSNKLQKAIDKLDIPDGYKVEMTGEDETINESMKQLVLMLVLAVIFIYLIMVVQFQSLLSPFIIMFSIPLAFTGGFIALLLTGQEINVLAMLGFIMLSGLIVNNGIVLIDYINQARRAGASKKEAIIESGKTRVRPILMTVLTTVLAMLTTALGIGDGSDMMRPMAITLIGGLVYGTILTLIVIPCIYDLFNREKDMTEEEI
ncbi:MAG: efflux RND transporter permease subunit [Agathobacter sp.]|nr:efflux RND transporter permease subunit [Lachnospiraceae bacterium]MDY2621200.1 efflux RND transporter permease subunit [Agathobacter sp.]